MFSSTMIWIGVIYAILVLIGAYRDFKYSQIRQREQEDRRRQQNREWHEQFNQLSPIIRAAIRMMREDQRDRAYVIALLAYYNHHKCRISKERVDWKKEGF